MSSPLTEETRRQIVRKWYGGEKKADIAARFHISVASIKAIIEAHEARVSLSFSNGYAPWLRARNGGGG
jgi:transposase